MIFESHRPEKAGILIPRTYIYENEVSQIEG